MGASNGYARPVQPVNGSISSWRAHTNRNPPSSEPGTDYYVPTGTPVRAAASGRVVDTGDSVYPATGRFVTIDLDDGRRVRYLHLSRRNVNVGNRVQWGQVIGLSGASGYGSDYFGESSRNDAFWNNTGGDHVHMTLWAHQRYTFGRYATLDPELYMAADQSEEDDMTPEQSKQLNSIFNAIFRGGESMPDGKRSIGSSLAAIHNKLADVNRGGKSVSLRQEIADTKTVVIGLEAAVKALALSQGADPDAILKAVQDGVEDAMRKVTFTADVDG